jgi:hypothetical protein
MTKLFATLAGTAAAAAAIAAVPLDAAGTNQPNESCQSAGQSSTVCQSPGDVEVKVALRLSHSIRTARRRLRPADRGRSRPACSRKGEQ